MQRILLLAAIFVCHLATYASYGQKKLSFNFKNAPFEKVIKEVQQKSGYLVWYEQNLLKEGNNVTLTITDVTLDEALEQCFHHQPLTYQIVDRTITITRKAKTEVKAAGQITGKVTDENGNALFNATVRVKNGQAATYTDEKGMFHINADENAVLVVTYIGFTPQEVRVNGRQTLSIALAASSSKLNEAVVVGYGTQSKKDITTSISSLRADDINNFPGTGVDKAMKGKLAGVQVLEPTGAPGAGISIHVRGTGTITAGSDPLYVVDGIPLSDNDVNGPGFKVNPLNSINVNDIESIDVLKDASAAAIYGSRGSNGVVIITTRKGKNEKPSINFNSYYGSQSVAKKIPMLNAEQYAQLIFDAHNNTYLDQLQSKGLTGSITDDNATRLNKLGAAPTNTSLAYLLPPEIFPYLNKQSGLTDTDWQDAIFRNAPIQNHTLSVGGGTEKVHYYVSGNYLDQDGIVINSGYRRYSGRVNVDATYNHLKLGANISYTYGFYNYLQTEGAFNNANQNIIEAALVASPFFSVYNPDGTYNYSQYRWQWSESNGVNPVALAMLKKDKTYEKKFLGSVFGEYEFTKGLKFRTSFAADISDYNRSTFNPSTLPSPLTLTTPSVPTGTYVSNQITNWVAENTLTYRKVFGEHSIQALAGFTLQRERSNLTSITATGYPNDLVQTLNGATVITSFQTGPNNTPTGINEWSLLSGLARVQYSFKDRYLLSAAIRADGSSRFGPNTKYGYFPSASAGWIVSNEKFMEQVRAISSLKVRLSYGVTGNFQIGNYAYLSTLSPYNYTFGSANGTLSSGLAPLNAANPNLSWEKTAAVNAGVDLGLFNGALNATVDVYNNKTSNLLLNIPVPLASGYATNLVNIGKVRNKGIEVTLSQSNQLGKFKLTNTVNYSANRNKVLDLGGVNSIITQAQNVIYFITQVGKPIANYYTLVKTGVFKDQAEIDATKAKVPGAKPGDFKFADVNADNVIDGNDKTITGNYQPKFIYGYSGQLQYSVVDLNVSLQGIYGNTVANIAQRHYNSMESYANNTTDALNRWESPEHPGNGVVARANRSQTGLNAQISTYHLSSASYLRVRDLTLGVSLPDKTAKSWKLNGLRLYFTAQNLWTFTHYNGYNPEVSIDSNPLTPGIDYGSYPVSKSFVAGINVKL